MSGRRGPRPQGRGLAGPARRAAARATRIKCRPAFLLSRSSSFFSCFDLQHPQPAPRGPKTRNRASEEEARIILPRVLRARHASRRTLLEAASPLAAADAGDVRKPLESRPRPLRHAQMRVGPLEQPSRGDASRSPRRRPWRPRRRRRRPPAPTTPRRGHRRGGGGRRLGCCCCRRRGCPGVYPGAVVIGLPTRPRARRAGPSRPG